MLMSYNTCQMGLWPSAKGKPTPLLSDLEADFSQNTESIHMHTIRKQSALLSTAPPVPAKQMRLSGIDHTLSCSPLPTIILSIGKSVLTNLTIRVWLEAEKPTLQGLQSEPHPNHLGYILPYFWLIEEEYIMHFELITDFLEHYYYGGGWNKVVYSHIMARSPQ